MNDLWMEGLDEEEWEEKHDDIICYLHGKCDEWVLKNFKEGDVIIVWNEYDYEREAHVLIHCFIKRDGSYVDVRGITDNIEEIKDGFDYSEDNDLYECYDKTSFKEFIRKTFGYEVKGDE